MTDQPTRITVRSTDDPTASVIDVEGDVTSGSEEPLMAAYARATDGGARTIVLDFGRLEYMNSGGIGLLVTLLVRVRRNGQRLLAIGLDDHYRQIFSLTRLDEAITIHESEASALAAASA